MPPTSRRGVPRTAVLATLEDAIATLLLADPPARLSLFSPLPIPAGQPVEADARTRAKDACQSQRGSERELSPQRVRSFTVRGLLRAVWRAHQASRVLLVRLFFTGPARRLPPINHFFTGSERLFARPQTLGCYRSITETSCER